MGYPKQLANIIYGPIPTVPENPWDPAIVPFRKIETFLGPLEF
jgi:hypothetical protein